MPQLGERKTIGDVTGEWDGQTWRQVEAMPTTATPPAAAPSRPWGRTPDHDLMGRPRTASGIPEAALETLAGVMTTGPLLTGALRAAPAVGRLVSAGGRGLAWMMGLTPNLAPEVTSAAQYGPALAKATGAAIQEAPIVGAPLKAATRAMKTFQETRPSAVAAREALEASDKAAKAKAAIDAAAGGAGPLEVPTNIVLGPEAMAQEAQREAILKMLAKRQGTGYAARNALR